MDKIIEIKGLYKSYGDIEAVKGLDFFVERGKLFAFLGPNGAGKSTTIDIICTFLAPDAGVVTIDGLRLGRQDTEIRKIIGAVFQDGVLDDLLTVEENLWVRGSFYGLRGRALRQAVSETAALTGITGLLKRPYGKLSGGQRRRCDIARALIHTPKILFLDEPTTGLDPQTRRYIWEMLAEIQQKNEMTIFLTTHYMEEAAAADYIIVIDQGKISAKGSPAALKEEFSSDRLLLSSQNPEALEERLQALGLSFSVYSGSFSLPLASTLDAIEILEGCQGLFDSFEVAKGTMDDAFIAITGKELRE